MTVIDILRVASEYLHLSDELAVFFDEELELVKDEISEETQKKFDKLLLAFNNTINEIATTKFPPKSTFVHYSTSGQNKVKLGEETGKEINKVLKIYSNSRKNIVFAQVDDEVIFNSDGGYVFIVYSFLPKIYKADDSLDIFYTLGTRLIAIGVASEYLYLSEIYDDSERLRREFEEGLAMVIQESLAIKARRWGLWVIEKKE